MCPLMLLGVGVGAWGGVSLPTPNKPIMIPHPLSVALRSTGI